jgi:hypothetical protein
VNNALDADYYGQLAAAFPSLQQVAGHGRLKNNHAYRLGVEAVIDNPEIARIWREIIAGITLAALAIPEVMGYTKISGTPVITGLYTLLIPMALFALFGSSRHLVVGAEYQHQDPIGQCSQTRDWCRESWAVANNSGFAGGNGYPNYVVAPDAKFATSENGIIAPCLDAGCAPGTGRSAFQSFNAGGTDLVPYDPGMWSAGFGGRIGGDGTIRAYDVSNIRADVERMAALGHVDIDLSDSLTLSFELAHSHSDSANSPANGGLGPFGPGVRIQPDNAYLTPALQAALPFGGVMNRIFAPDVFSANNTTEADTDRFIVSAEGDLGSNWNWDAYYEHGESTYHQQLIHNADRSILGIPGTYTFFGWALDAVRSDPNDPTSPIVCRATIQGDPAYNPLAAGCVPLNFFGVGNTDPAAIDYAWRTLKEDSAYTQNVVGMNFRSPPIRVMSCSPELAWMTEPDPRKRQALKKAWVRTWKMAATKAPAPAPRNM